MKKIGSLLITPLVLLLIALLLVFYIEKSQSKVEVKRIDKGAQNNHKTFKTN